MMDRALTRISAKLSRQLIRWSIALESRRARVERGSCPNCGGMLTEQKKGWYRCDHCR